MNKNTRNKIIGIVITVLLIALVALTVRIIITVNKNEKEVEKNDILEFLNEKYRNESIPSYSPVYGLLNYTFSSLGGNVTMDVLNNTHMIHYSALESVGVDNIYKSKFGMTKGQYMASSNYVIAPESNCYYHQNNLRDSSYDCDNICSSSNGTIISFLSKKLSYDNIGLDEINTFCKRNALFPLDSSNRIFIDVYKLKNIYNELTGQDFNYTSDVTSNEYYDMGAYLVDLKGGFTENITDIKSIEIESIDDNKIVVSYVAKTDNNRDINGKVTLSKLEDKKYIILSNDNDLKNII